LSRSATVSLLATAERMVTGLVNVPHANALKLASEFGISAYDARFLGAAQSLGLSLITEDAKLRASAPALTRSLANALAA
jgi:predicted nucleic acid-binding protein